MPSRYSMTRDAIDEAIAHSTNLKTFDYILTQMGYEHCLSDSRKYWTIVPKGYKKPIRLKSLGENYTEDAIKRRLTEKSKGSHRSFCKGNGKSQTIPIAHKRTQNQKGRRIVWAVSALLL